MATAPAFAATPRNSSVVISTANTARDGSGTLGTVITAGASGSRVDEVTIKATAATTAGMVRLYVHNGTTAFLYREQIIAAVTPSASVKTEEYVLTFVNLFLPSGYSLRAAPHNAESFAVTATGGDF
jgi:hypothetical protein